MAGFIVPAAILAAKAGKSYFANKSKKKQNVEQKRADVSALNTQQKMGEDSRMARVKLGGSMLNSVPKTTGDGSINTGVGIDPALLAELGAERKYDFASGIADRNKGAGSAFLSGLFGDVADTAADMYGGGAMRSQTPNYAAYGAQPSASTVSWEDLLAQYNSGAK